MAVYEYRCPNCGLFELAGAIGSATATQRCRVCGAEARRSYSAPHLARTPKPLADALTRAEKSRDEPEVVTRIPPRQGSRPRRPPDPRLKRLPRW